MMSGSKSQGTPEVLMQLDKNELQSIKVKITRRNVNKPYNTALLQRGLEDPADLKVHLRPDEGVRPIFDREDVRVNLRFSDSPPVNPPKPGNDKARSRSPARHRSPQPHTSRDYPRRRDYHSPRHRRSSSRSKKVVYKTSPPRYRRSRSPRRSRDRSPRDRYRRRTRSPSPYRRSRYSRSPDYRRYDRRSRSPKRHRYTPERDRHEIAYQPAGIPPYLQGPEMWIPAPRIPPMIPPMAFPYPPLRHPMMYRGPPFRPRIIYNNPRPRVTQAIASATVTTTTTTATPEVTECESEGQNDNNVTEETTDENK
ncbi:serine/arginine repetitive matrix protein 1 [Tribolium castaneum]|nr:PREDICTED: serine/arginine repetitive matrix protein 1 [Tribolium castaneum]XP_008196633.1 PREDICTED: serine/arginine repetitive matrix protein 1 [Tribolium castaneum]|eukprot:XP_008196632.1 PREDICTED: serine/arginine repetitive matrix protein 1 [Tribolium castaneum]